MKKCTKCLIKKDSSTYGKKKDAKDGLSSWCKDCVNKNSKKRIRTKKGLIFKIHNSQRHHSRLRGHREPEYTREALLEWALSQKIFHELYEEWKQSGYKKLLVPSVDRKNNDIHYCMNNIQLTTWETNKARGHRDMRLGKITNGPTPQKRVRQYTTALLFIAEYHCIMEAERQTGVLHNGISKNCLGKAHTAGGFVWRFA